MTNPTTLADYLQNDVPDGWATARTLEKQRDEVLAKLSDNAMSQTVKDAVTFICNLSEYEALQQERASLLVQIAVKDEAIKWSIDAGCERVDNVLRNAIANSPAASKEMVERMARMEKALKTISKANPVNSMVKPNDCYKIAQEALSITQPVK